MVKIRRFLYSLCIVILLLSSAAGREMARAADEVPKRQTTLVVSVTQYEWWLIRWSDNQIVCVLVVEHEGLPRGEEIAKTCGGTLYESWKATPPCAGAGKEPPVTSACAGMYLFLAGFRAVERTLTIDLPMPSVWVTLANCSPTPPGNLCTVLPSLRLTGEEPLPNERIVAIHAVVDEIEHTCNAAMCDIPLRPTTLEGMTIEFWADSSFGDASEHFTALVRVVDSGVRVTSAGAGWYVDVMSSQWRGGEIETCAQVWDVFLPAGGPPFWLSMPEREELMASTEPYYYLAGRLIDKGLVDAQDCPADGLLANGYATACGLEKARSLVELWQNQFDPRIYHVAEETGLPAMLMKKLFAQESQFWPGVFRVAREYGLGQLTDQGADTILLWNPSFFEQFCPLVLEASACSRGYLKLQDDERAILRGALAVQANADCAACPAGIDLRQADFSVMLFAQTLLANCGQVSRTMYNATQQSPGAVSSYEDLWRFTLVNYHAGPGCLAYAIHTTWDEAEPMDWEHVATHFTEACQSAVDYVTLITR